MGGFTPIELVIQGHVEIVKYLYTHLQSTNTNPDFSSAALYSQQFMNNDVENFFIKNGIITVNVQDQNNLFSSDMSAINEDINIAKSLLGDINVFRDTEKISDFSFSLKKLRKNDIPGEYEKLLIQHPNEATDLSNFLLTLKNIGILEYKGTKQKGCIADLSNIE